MSLIAGITCCLHFVLLAPVHCAHAPAHGIFFALAGVAELLWAAAFWRKPTSRLYYLGLALAGGLLVLWAMTRFLIAPFEHEPATWDLGGLVCKASELVAILALGAMAVQGKIIGLPTVSLARAAGLALSLSLAAGVLSYGVGMAREPVLPSLAGSVEHDHAGDSAAMQVGDEHTSSDESGAAVRIGDLQIEQPWAGVAPVGSTGGVFMLINLLQPLKAGDHIRLTLEFQEAGSVNVDAVVQAP